MKNEYNTIVLTSKSLEKFYSPVKLYKKRFGYKKLQEYLYSDITDKVFILYGLRRTGKSTMIRQAILEMNDLDKEKTAYIQISII